MSVRVSTHKPEMSAYAAASDAIHAVLRSLNYSIEHTREVQAAYLQAETHYEGLQAVARTLDRQHRQAEKNRRFVERYGSTFPGKQPPEIEGQLPLEDECNFCHGAPVLNARRWMNLSVPLYAACPRCGKEYKPWWEGIQPTRWVCDRCKTWWPTGATRRAAVRLPDGAVCHHNHSLSDGPVPDYEHERWEKWLRWEAVNGTQGEPQEPYPLRGVGRKFTLETVNPYVPKELTDSYPEPQDPEGAECGRSENPYTPTEPQEPS